ncbi:DUF1593 domain-containing protein [Patulibacter americanus]|uniref:DUF1593 domain-containing protein n=1 Tax=Patulibacter americanus TaxID=588672 RepID=UPI0003B30C4C|nr:DUF1593 domain-containing protein [Patulibacter americanus]
MPLFKRAAAAALVTAACFAGASTTAASASGWPGVHGDAKPRTIVTTDPELDDLNSLIRMLLYSNEIQIEGLVYGSSEYHWAGDGVTPPHRWKAGQSHVEDALDAYDQVDENLRRHDRDFPTADELRATYRVGNIALEGDMAASTPGSKLIADALLDRRPGQVFLQAWGGTNTIARALKDIEERYAGTPQWDAIREKVSRKAVITRYGAQDDTYETYIKPAWPQLENREVATSIWGYGARRVIGAADSELIAPAWTRANVTSVGPLGALYRVWGDGRFMADGFDAEDFFGFDSTKPENSRENLIARGYDVWIGLQPPGSFISEGDSSNFALLIDNGLRSWERPGNGGWGGRQVRNPTNPYLYSSATGEAGDADLSTGTKPADFHALRWWRAIQHDFAARLRWTVTPDRRSANHEPAARVLGRRDVRVRPGQRVVLAGLATDPDRQRVTSSWWHYPEAGTYPGRVDLRAAGPAALPVTTFTVPRDATAGQTIHLILEVRDTGTPSMTSYQRVVATVR